MRAHDPSETVLKGQASTGGLCWGEALVLGEGREAEPVGYVEASMVDAELECYRDLRERAAEELRALVNMARQRGGGDVADIVNTQLEILGDPDLNQEVTRLIREGGFAVGNAIEQVFKRYIGRIEETGNSHMIERVADLKDIRDRLYRLLNRQSGAVRGQGNILVGMEITPTELLEYSGSISGAVMGRGGATSHVAIIAASLGIPLVMGVRELHRLVRTGDSLLVDGDHGEVVLHPSSETLAAAKDLQPQVRLGNEARWRLPAVTTCGKRITVRANVELEQELKHMPHFAPEGIGLVRTESLVMMLGHTEASLEQQAYYETMASAAGEHGVTIRLLDVGGDKLTERTTGEANPNLGWRGARVLLDRTVLLDSQLEAILTVSGRHPGKIRVMMPMVTTLDEWRYFRKHFQRVVERLKERDVPVDEHIPLGLMVEVPSVALRAHLFAKEADFMSIGTNDLTQYVLAVDRGNPMVAHLFDGLHPSVLQAVEMSVHAAQEAGIPISVCGETAGNPVSAACLIGLGVTELSMQMANIPAVRTIVAAHPMETFHKMAQMFRDADSLDERRELVAMWSKALSV